MSGTEERWRQISGFEGSYEVSNHGRVRSVARWVAARDGRRLVEGRILSLALSNGRYWKVELSNGDRQITENVHRLVAHAFVPGSGDVVRHLDGDGFNNHESNLAWGSHIENEADKARHGRVPRGVSHPRAALTAELLHQIRDMHARGFSQLAIARVTGINRGTVGNVVRGEAYAGT